jgi:hypothetical protein
MQNYFFRPAFLLVISANVVVITNEEGVAGELVRGLMSYRFFLFFGGLASSQATLVTCRSQA